MKIKRSTDVDKAQRLIRELNEFKKAAAEASSAIHLLNEQLMEIMKNSELKTVATRDGGKKYQVTVVAPSDRAVVDSEGLLKAVPVRTSNKFIKKVVVNDLLEKFMDESEENAELASKFITMKPATPYLKFTEGVDDDFVGQ